MQRKLNDEFIREYSEEFSEKASSAFFESNNSISGKEILTFTPSAQVNFFVLKSLFRKWQLEMKSLESPFFNYKNPEVRKAMVQFMNTLSQNIEVEKDAYKSMLEEAVAETILLANDPASYLILEFETLDVPVITEKVTKPILKYIKIHKEDLKEFFERNEGVELDDFLANAEDLADEFDTDDALLDEIASLSQVLKVNEEELFENEDDDFEDDDFSDDDLISSVEEEADDEIKLVAPEGDIPGTDVQEAQESGTELLPAVEDEEIASDANQPESVQQEEDANTPTDNELLDTAEVIDDTSLEPASHSGEKSESDLEGSEDSDEVKEYTHTETTSESVEEEVQELVIADDEDSQPVEQEETEKPTTEVEPEEPDSLPSTVNDTFSKKESSTLAETLENKKVDSIMDAISVNHRYMFTKELFDGDREAFVEAISDIEARVSFDDAVELLVQKYAKELSWDMNSEEVKELLKVIFRKFR